MRGAGQARPEDRKENDVGTTNALHWVGAVNFFLLAFCIVAGVRWYAKHVLEGRTTYPSALPRRP